MRLLLLLAIVLCGACAQEVDSQSVGSIADSNQDSNQLESNHAVNENQDADEAEQVVGAMALYRRAQQEMEDNKYEEGYETAKEAMQQFIAENNDLAWMLLESIELDGFRIDCHFNMGPDERDPKDNGIARPLSFRIWSADETLMQTIDFELGYVQGEAMTAAIGETTTSGHANYGILPVDATYESIRKAVMGIVADQ